MTQDMSFFLLPLLLLLLYPIATTSIIQYEPTCPSSFSGYKAGPGCTTYYICSEGSVASPVTECQPGTIFSEVRSVCDLEGNFQCKTTLPPTSRPTKQPTHSPTTRLAPSTLSPTLTAMCFTTPDEVAGMTVSIFMADSVSRASPS